MENKTAKLEELIKKVYEEDSEESIEEFYLHLNTLSPLIEDEKIVSLRYMAVALRVCNKKHLLDIEGCSIWMDKFREFAPKSPFSEHQDHISGTVKTAERLLLEWKKK